MFLLAFPCCSTLFKHGAYELGKRVREKQYNLKDFLDVFRSVCACELVKGVVDKAAFANNRERYDEHIPTNTYHVWVTLERGNRRALAYQSLKTGYKAVFLYILLQYRNLHMCMYCV